MSCGVERLLRALGDFDAATIATTHGFCQEVLGGLGVAGDLEPDAVLVEDVGDLLAEVVDDLYVRRYMNDEDAPPIRRAEAMQIARETVGNPGAPIEPRDTSARICPRCARGWRRACARSSSAASAHCR